jgi:ribosomal protein L11 methyltransferase
LWIGPPWETPPDAVAVVIDPGRAFGTGAHATTRLSVEALDALPRGSLLDVGCGSGVVAIAGAKLGFAPVTAVDADPAAIEVARTNARANRVDFEAFAADATRDPLPHADVAVANIALDIVEGVAMNVDCELLVTSGYLEAQEPEIARGHVRRLVRDGWAADVWRTGAPG